MRIREYLCGRITKGLSYSFFVTAPLLLTIFVVFFVV